MLAGGVGRYMSLHGLMLLLSPAYAVFVFCVVWPLAVIVCAMLCAGGVFAAGRSQITISDSVLVGNYVKDYWSSASGGACYVNDTAVLSLVKATVSNNEAQQIGGGVAMGSSRCCWQNEGVCLYWLLLRSALLSAARAASRLHRMPLTTTSHVSYLTEHKQQAPASMLIAQCINGR